MHHAGIVVSSLENAKSSDSTSPLSSIGCTGKDVYDAAVAIRFGADDGRNAPGQRRRHTKDVGVFTFGLKAGE
jgi:hypothetical protein